jgi:hypothetical protein
MNLKQCEMAIRKHILSELSSYKGKIQSNATQRCIICYNQSTKINDIKFKAFIHKPQLILKFNQWADFYCFHNSLSESIPLSNLTDINIDAMRMPAHISLRRITHPHWSLPQDTRSCDVVCMVVQVILNENKASYLIVWDGTTDGTLSKSNILLDSDTTNNSNSSGSNNHKTSILLNHSTGITTSTKTNLSNDNNTQTIDSNYNVIANTEDAVIVNHTTSMQHAFQDICHSLHASCLFAKQMQNINDASVNSFHNLILTDSTNIDEHALKGDPVCLITSDIATYHVISSLKPGMWIRVRNIHLDYSPVSALRNIHTTHGIEIVGAVYTDTHITPLFPYFR